MGKVAVFSLNGDSDMEISDDLLCLFSAEIDERDGSYVIDVPEREVSVGEVDGRGTYRVALLPTEADGATASSDPEGGSSAEPSADRGRGDHAGDGHADHPDPPVDAGEQRTVDIEGIGEQGDGIARVERGYVVIVPDTEKGERVTVEITDVKQNVGFAEVLERKDYYE